MNYKGDNNQCDICASKGCSYCTGKVTKVKSLDLMEMYYAGANFAELVFDRATNTISVVSIERSIIKDIGILSTKSHSSRLPDDMVFYSCDTKYKDILGENLEMITTGCVSFWSQAVIKKLVAYTVKKKWVGVDYKINSPSGPVFLDIPTAKDK